jgi:hypothetical protein
VYSLIEAWYRRIDVPHAYDAGAPAGGRITAGRTLR